MDFSLKSTGFQRRSLDVFHVPNASGTAVSSETPDKVAKAAGMLDSWISHRDEDVIELPYRNYCYKRSYPLKISGATMVQKVLSLENLWAALSPMDPCFFCPIFFHSWDWSPYIKLNKGSSGRFVSGAVYWIPGPRPNPPKLVGFI